MKIYNKKGFWSGIGFLCLFAVSIGTYIVTGYKYKSTGRLIKSMVIDIGLFYYGISSILRSLSYSATKDDIQSNDERQKLISLKAESISLKVSVYFCFFMLIFSIIMFAKTKIWAIAGAIVSLGLLINVMLVTPIIASIYYEKHE